MLLKKLKQDQALFEKAYFDKDTDNALLYEYLAFSRFMQDLFLSEGEYIIPTGNFETANLALLPMIINRIKKHPIIWKLFFNK